MVGTATSECQLTGNVNLDDGFQAASSSKRLSSLDPELLAIPSDSAPESGPSSDSCGIGFGTCQSEAPACAPTTVPVLHFKLMMM